MRRKTKLQSGSKHREEKKRELINQTTLHRQRIQSKRRTRGDRNNEHSKEKKFSVLYGKKNKR